jgi:hypothetical protein
MAYARLTTRNSSGLHPNLRGLGSYAPLSTKVSAGLNPNFRGIGDVPLTTFTIGPGGQFAISSATTPTQTSLWDEMLTWLGQSSYVPGMPNSVFAIGGAFLAVIAVKGWGRRR